MIFLVAGQGRPGQQHIPAGKSRATEKVLVGKPQKQLSWRHGTEDRVTARLAALPARMAGGPTYRNHDRGNQHLPVKKSDWSVIDA